LDLMKEAESNIVESGALPRTEHFTIHPGKIGDIIGKAGATIRDIIEKFEVSIDLDRDAGGVKVSGKDKEKVTAAKEHIQKIATAPTKKQMTYEVGKSYRGKVKKIVDFGIFVEMPDGFDALLHISKVAKERVNNLHERYHEGDEITVVVMEQICQETKDFVLRMEQFHCVTKDFVLMIKLPTCNGISSNLIHFSFIGSERLLFLVGFPFLDSLDCLFIDLCPKMTDPVLQLGKLSCRQWRIIETNSRETTLAFG